MKKRIIIFLLFFYTINSFACLSTTQYKTFPIGTINNQIITIDAYISRSDYIDRDNKSEYNFPKIMWIIESYISIYNEKQELISTKLIEKRQLKKEKYLPLLREIYLKGIRLINDEFKGIEYFKPEYISFGDFQKKCEKLELKHDTISKKDLLVYKKKEYHIRLESLKGYENYKTSMLFPNSLSAYLISSIRIYKTNKIELVIGHIETGHEISMGWITNDPNKKPKDENDIVIYPKEHKPDFEFSKLENAVYQEPLLHHAFGFDFFIVNKIE